MGKKGGTAEPGKGYHPEGWLRKGAAPRRTAHLRHLLDIPSSAACAYDT